MMISRGTQETSRELDAREWLDRIQSCIKKDTDKLGQYRTTVVEAEEKVTLDISSERFRILTISYT
jgi:hypothetical protein